MKNLYIYCEGATEESFIDKVLCPYLLECGIYVRPIVCVTKRTVNKKYSGGISDYRKIKSELIKLCKQHKNESLTTMFDLYGLPKNTPGMQDTTGDLYKRVKRIQYAVEAEYYDYSDKFLAEMIAVYNKVRELAVMVTRIDWVLSGDDGEETYYERLEEDMAEIEYDNPDNDEKWIEWGGDDY